jgi:Helix-turn-helix domain
MDSPEKEISVSDILDVDQLAVFLGVPRNTIFGLTRKRAELSGDPIIPHFRIGRTLKFRRESVIAWLAAKEQAVSQCLLTLSARRPSSIEKPQ